MVAGGRGSDPTGWVAVRGADDLPPDRLERVTSLGRVSTPDMTDAERAAPQAYLVAQGSATEPLPVHFHTVDQFQYFAHGAGVVGVHEVGHGVVHYSDALTPYGPLRPGEDGMSYLTLRAVHDGGVHYMPASRPELGRLLDGSSRPAGERRNVAVDLTGPVEAGEWHHLREDADGLRVSVVELPSGGEAAPLVVGGSGAYAVVVAGAVEVDGVAVEPCALRWVEPGERLVVRSGPEGGRVALLQYPARSGGGAPGTS